MRIADAFISVLLILGGSVSSAGQTGRQQAKEVFPTAKGTYWMYRGSASDGYVDQNGELQWHSTKLTLKMEVVDRVQQGRYKVTRLLGHPSELAWTANVEKRRCHLWIAIDDKEFYLGDCSPVQESRTPLALTDPEITEMIKEENLIFRLPLEEGGSFGGMTDFPSYKWQVNDVKPFKEGAIRGLPSMMLRMEYGLEFVTSYTSVWANYVPGIGVIHYGARQGGTSPHLMGLDLVEFKSPNQK